MTNNYHSSTPHTILIHQQFNMTSSSTVRLPSYRKLKQLRGDDDDDDDKDGYYDFEKERVVKNITKPRSNIFSWYKLKAKLGERKRPRLRLKRKVVSLKRLLILRKKLKLACGCVRVSCQKIVKRFKEGQSHFGDLFAGNYMLMQINPSSFKSVDQRRKEFLAGVGGELKHHNYQIQSISSKTGMGKFYYCTMKMNTGN